MQSKTTFLKTIWAIFAKPIWDWSMIERAKIILLFEMQLWFKIERGFYCLLWLSHTLTQAFYFQDWQVLSQGFPHTLHNIQYYLLACLPPIEDSRLEDSWRLWYSGYSLVETTRNFWRALFETRDPDSERKWKTLEMLELLRRQDRVLELRSAPWNSRIFEDSRRLSLKSPVETMW